jgi:hypothetical protein
LSGNKNSLVTLHLFNSKPVKKLFSTTYPAHAFTLATSLLLLTCGGFIIPYRFNNLIFFARLAQIFSAPFHIGYTPFFIFAVFAEFFCTILVLPGLLT